MFVGLCLCGGNPHVRFSLIQGSFCMRVCMCLTFYCTLPWTGRHTELWLMDYTIYLWNLIVNCVVITFYKEQLESQVWLFNLSQNYIWWLDFHYQWAIMRRSVCSLSLHKDNQSPLILPHSYPPNLSRSFPRDVCLCFFFPVWISLFV